MKTKGEPAQSESETANESLKAINDYSHPGIANYQLIAVLNQIAENSPKILAVLERIALALESSEEESTEMAN